MNRSVVPSLVFMGVAGCGKSTLAAAVAQAQGLRLLEGDEFHSPANRAKMSQGVPLDDTDRDGWLHSLGDQLRAAPDGMALTCSALKRKYRDRLREASPGVCFIFLDLSREAALVREGARAAHFFSASLVDSQFEALERPDGEPGVLRVDATASLDELQSQVSGWLQGAVTSN